MRELPSRSARVRARAKEGHAAGLAVLLLVGACHRGKTPEDEEKARRSEPQPLVHKECTGKTPQDVDVNNDGKPDIRAQLENGKRVCAEIDMNFDGKVDVRRFYAADGQTVAFEQHDYDFDGRLDDQA